MGIFLKDPAARIDYALDWSSAYLGAETVVRSDWRVTPVEPGGVTIVVSQTEPGRTAATVAGGIAGHVYRLANCVTLSNGRLDERALTIRVEDR